MVRSVKQQEDRALANARADLQNAQRPATDLFSFLREKVSSGITQKELTRLQGISTRVIDMVAQQGNIVDAAVQLNVGPATLRKWLVRQSKTSPRIVATPTSLSIDKKKITVFTDAHMIAAEIEGLSDKRAAALFATTDASIFFRRRKLGEQGISHSPNGSSSQNGNPAETKAPLKSGAQQIAIPTTRYSLLPRARPDDPETHPMTSRELARFGAPIMSSLDILRGMNEQNGSNSNKYAERLATIEKVRKKMDGITEIENEVVSAVMHDDNSKAMEILAKLSKKLDAVASVIQPDRNVPVQDLRLRDLSDLLKEQVKMVDRYILLLRPGLFEADGYHAPLNFASIFSTMTATREQQMHLTGKQGTSWIGEESISSR